MMKTKVPEKYSDLITFREDVGDNGRYLVKGVIPVVMYFEYMAEGFDPDWIVEHFPITLEELQRVHEFIGDIL